MVSQQRADFTVASSPTQVSEQSWSPGRIQDFGDNSFRCEQLDAGSEFAFDASASPLTGEVVDDVPVSERKSPVADASVVVALGPHAAMRDSILRGPPFFYDEALVTKQAKDPHFEFWVCAPGKTTAATPDEISAWGKPGTSVTIVLSGKVVASLLAYKVHALGTSVGLREGLPASIADELEACLARAAGGDTTALDELVDLAKREPLVALRVEALAAEGGAAHAGLQLAAAKLAVQARVDQDRSDAAFMGPVGEEVPKARQADVERIRALVERASVLAAGANRQQASALMTQAAAMYRALGMEREAQERDYIARMYSMTDIERRSMSQRVSRTTPGSNALQATPQETQDLLAFYRKNPDFDNRNAGEPRLEIFGRADAPDKEASFKISDQKVIGTNGGTRTTTIRSTEANAQGISAGKAASGAGSLIQQVNLWVSTHAKMLEIASKVAERERLQRAVTEAHTYIKPPTPAQVATTVRDFEARFGKATDVEVPGIGDLRRRLALLQEASHAAWP